VSRNSLVISPLQVATLKTPVSGPHRPDLFSRSLADCFDLRQVPRVSGPENCALAPPKPSAAQSSSVGPPCCRVSQPHVQDFGAWLKDKIVPTRGDYLTRKWILHNLHLEEHLGMVNDHGILGFGRGVQLGPEVIFMNALIIGAETDNKSPGWAYVEQVLPALRGLWGTGFQGFRAPAREGMHVPRDSRALSF